tara:strand:+ start:3679 stop:4347 length:669 start_codon:yes stop_codon:yes gene_type:complete
MLLLAKGKLEINTNQNIRVGIYGGAFDPIHIGHVEPIIEITNRHRLNKIHFIPTNISSESKKIKATPEQRLLMMQEAIGKTKNFIIDDREIRRGGKSYTCDTVKEIKKEYPSEVQLYCIIGYDLLDSIHSWKSFEDILQLSNILVVRREGFNNHSATDKVLSLLTANQSVFHNESCGKIFIEDTSAINVTSRDIRYRLKNNLSISGLVNLDLEKWLHKNKIY